MVMKIGIQLIDCIADDNNNNNNNNNNFFQQQYSPMVMRKFKKSLDSQLSQVSPK